MDRVRDLPHPPLVKAPIVWFLAFAQLAAVVAFPSAGAAAEVANPACPDPSSSARWAAARFSDVDVGHSHAADIGCIAHHEITTGVGDGRSFAPSVSVPRWQMALFLSRAVREAGLELPEPPPPFSDLGELTTAEAGGVMATVALGIMPGTTSSAFDPHGLVTRAQMALFLARMLEVATVGDSPIRLRFDPSGQVSLARRDGTAITVSHPFTDVGEADVPHRQAIGALHALGVARGVSQDSFSPDGEVTRAQMASFIVRALGHTSLRHSEAAAIPGDLSEAAAGLGKAFRTVFESPHASPNMCLVAYLNDQLVFGELADRPLLPASLVKVVTASVFLDEAGADYRFATEVFIERAAGEAVDKGVLESDLYLVGGGDPVLSTPNYFSRFDPPRAHTDITRLADAVAASLTGMGVSVIEGAVVADESRYPEQERHYVDMRLSEDGDPIWKPSYVSSNQAGPLSALLLNDGYTLYRGYRRSYTRAVDPALHTARVFDDLLEARGFTIRHRSEKGVAPSGPQRTSVGVVHSPPARQIIARMLRFSDNTTAEMLFKETGRLAGDGSAWDQAVKASNLALPGLLDLPGSATAGFQVADGSGLSYSNRLTCRTVAELLRRAGPGSALVEGLSVAGENGTLRNCPPGNPPFGAVAAEGGEVKGKTGTLNDSMALAGVTVAPNGDVITFALIAHEPLILLRLRSCNALRTGAMGAAVGHPYR